MADYYIQELFNTGKIEVKDHFQDEYNRLPSDLLFQTIIKRLQSEHRELAAEAKIDPRKYTIALPEGHRLPLYTELVEISAAKPSTLTYIKNKIREILDQE